MTAISERLGLSIEDRVEIEEQSCRYSLAYDTRDADAFLGVFCDDGVFEAVLTGEADPLATVAGAAELRGFVERGAPGGGAAVHVVSGIVVDEVDEGQVRTRSSVIVTKQLKDGPAVVTHGRYEDVWRREPTGWRLAHRRYVSAGYPPYRPSTREGEGQ